MTDHTSATDYRNRAERAEQEAREAWACADRLADWLACVMDDSHSYESEGMARQEARQALAAYRAERVR